MTQTQTQTQTWLPLGRSVVETTPTARALTPAGRAALSRELRVLRDERLPALTELLREAHADTATRDEDGGLREIVEEHSRAERRAMELDRLLALAGALAPADDGVAGLGSRVEIDADGEHDAFQLVDPCEADIAAGRLSVASPVGRALLGLTVGAEVAVRLPVGEMRLRLVALTNV